MVLRREAISIRDENESRTRSMGGLSRCHHQLPLAEGTLILIIFVKLSNILINSSTAHTSSCITIYTPSSDMDRSSKTADLRILSTSILHPSLLLHPPLHFHSYRDLIPQSPYRRRDLPSSYSWTHFLPSFFPSLSLALFLIFWPSSLQGSSPPLFQAHTTQL